MHYPIRQLSPAEFPELLREIPDVPKKLFVRGTLPSSDLKLLCVVGSRATSSYGRRVCASLISGLARYPFAIVSGLAMGIDGEAHKTALEVGLPAVAVLPSSADDTSVYPAVHYALAQKILEKGGALVSEYEAPFRPRQYSFAARNRIMAGMSHAALIIEAGEKSGTLITARLALDYNRDVLAVPHELGKETGAGVNRLIREGATLVRGSEDILEALGVKPTTKGEASLPVDLTQAESRILEVLVEPLFRDELVHRARISIHETNVALSSLLIRGLLVERLGRIERIGY